MLQLLLLLCCIVDGVVSCCLHPVHAPAGFVVVDTDATVVAAADGDAYAGDAQLCTCS